MKKADVDIGFLVGIVASIIAFIVIIQVTMLMISKSEESSAIQTCKSSVIARANSVLGLGISEIKVKIKTFPFLCKTFDKRISGTKEEVMKQVADYMVKCWSMFSEGRFENTIDPIFYGNNCFPCYRLAIDDIKETDEINWNEFQDWLLTNNFTISVFEENKVIKKSINYVDYLTNYEGIPGTLSIDDIKEKEIYYILYFDSIMGASFKEKPNGIILTPVSEQPKFKNYLGPIQIGETTCQILKGI